MTNYVGIDYGNGVTNIDVETGIRFGVISQHSVMPEALDYFEPDYGEPTCECGRPLSDSNGEKSDEVEDADWFDGKDFYCESCKITLWSHDVYSPDAEGLGSYQKDGYRLTGCLDADIFVLKSPYFTFAQFCSPCVPGACNLDNPMAEGAKCYALGHDWFEDRIAPYPVYVVKTGVLVEVK